MSWDAFKVKVADFFATSGLDIIKGVVLFLIGYLLIKLALKFTNRVLTKGKVEKSVRKFLYNVVRFVLYFLLIMIILSSFNVSITGLIAILSAIGLALSLALQNSLSNLANGVILIISKPFKQGDVVKVNNIDGVISEIGMTHTILTSFENKEIRIPNKMIAESIVENGTVLENRKINFSFLVSYKSDVDKVKDIILKVFSDTDYVLTNPQPFVGLQALEERGIRFTASCFCQAKHYAQTYYPVLEEIFNEFKKNNIVLPYAQLDVRLKEEKEVLPVSKTTRLLQKSLHEKEETVSHKPESTVKEKATKKSERENVKEDDSVVEVEHEEKYADYLDKVNVIDEIEVEEIEIHEEPVKTKLNYNPKETETKNKTEKKIYFRKI